MRSHNIDTVARLFYGHGFNSYTDLMKMSVPLRNYRRLQRFCALDWIQGLQGQWLVWPCARQTSEGAKIITIHPRQHNLTMVADLWLQPQPGEELALLRRLVELTGHSSKSGNSSFSTDRERELSQIAALLADSPLRPVILVGSEFFSTMHPPRYSKRLRISPETRKAGVLSLPSHNNLYGSIAMGAYGELLPGGYSVTDSDKRANLAAKWGVELPVPNSIGMLSHCLAALREKYCIRW